MVHHAAFGLPLESLDIVVVDDSRSMQTIIRSMLGSLGIARLRIFDGVADAMEAMLTEPPNVIVTDWRMSPTSGYVMARQIRHRMMAPLCYVPVVMVTAHGTRALVEKALRAGVHYFVIKPLAPRTLHERLNHLVSDDREFVLSGDSYVIEGVEAQLEEQNLKWSALESARRYQFGAMRQAATFQVMVDKIITDPTDKPARVAQ